MDLEGLRISVTDFSSIPGNEVELSVAGRAVADKQFTLGRGSVHAANRCIEPLSLTAGGTRAPIDRRCNRSAARKPLAARTECHYLGCVALGCLDTTRELGEKQQQSRPEPVV